MTKDETLKLALEALIGSRTFLKSDTPVEVWEMNTTAINECVKALTQPDPSAYWHSEFLKYNTTSDHRMMENAQGELERIKLVQTGVGIGKPEGCQCPACKITPHASDCAVHNAPAYPIGKCDCGAQLEQDNTYNYAKSLAEAIFKQHFASDEHYASGRIVWGVNDTVIGILTQIDNMVADMVRRPAQPKQDYLAGVPPMLPQMRDGETIVVSEQEPVVCPDGKQCKHEAWCTETYCQEHCEFRAPPQRKPLSMQERTSIVRANKSFHDKNEIDAYGIIDDVEAAHGIKE